MLVLSTDLCIVKTPILKPAQVGRVEKRHVLPYSDVLLLFHYIQPRELKYIKNGVPEIKINLLYIRQSSKRFVYLKFLCEVWMF